MTRRSHLSAIDASSIYSRIPGQHMDATGGYVFACPDGAAPSREQIARFLTQRSPDVAGACLRVAEVPGGLDHPYLLADPLPLAQRTVFADTGTATWADVLAAATRRAAEPIDVSVATKDLLIFDDVREVPGVPGRAIVVLTRDCHSVNNYEHDLEFANSLFGGAGPVDLPALRPAARRAPARPIAALRGARAFVGSLARFPRVRRALEAEAADAPVQEPPRIRPATSLTAVIGPDRSLAVVPIPPGGLRREGVTATAVAATIVSRAVQRYFEAIGEPCPDDLALSIPTPTDRPREWSMNRFVLSVVDLHPTIDDPIERAAAINDDLRTAIADNDGPHVLRTYRLVTALPAPHYRRLVRAGVEAESLSVEAGTTSAHVGLSSMNFPDSDRWECAGAPVAFSFKFAPVSTSVGLNHVVSSTANGASVITAMAAPESVPRFDRYVECLTAAVDEVCAALPAR